MFNNFVYQWFNTSEVLYKDSQQFYRFSNILSEYVQNCAKHIKVSCAGGNVNTININKRKVKNGKQKKETEEAT